MSLRNLSQAALITHTRYFTGPLRADLLAQPSLAWVPPVLDALLDELVALETDPQAAIAEARRAASASDAVFDHLVRTLFYLCKAAASFALARGEAERAGAYEGLRHALLPGGLTTVNLSYIEEAAEADRVEGRLDDGDRALLDETQIFGMRMSALVADWQAAARALGEADRARTDIEADVVENRGPALSRTRKRWMDVIRAMRATAVLLPPSVERRIFRKLEESEARADARVAARRASGGAPVAVVDEAMPLDGADVRMGEADDAMPLDGADVRMGEADEPLASVEPAEAPAPQDPLDEGAERA